MPNALLFVHLICFAAYLGAAFGQTRLLRRSRAKGMSPDVVVELERLTESTVTKIGLPAIFGSIASGIGFIVMSPTVMKFGWMHGKLTCVLLLAVVSHLEMFNIRKIVRARAAGGEALGAIDALKSKHEALGKVASMLVLAVLVLVTFVRLG